MAPGDSPGEYRNEIDLIGRVSNSGVIKTLPSGDTVVEFRLIVGRDNREGVDTLDVAVWKNALKKRALGLEPNEWVAVTGAIRRRFWRSGAILASRWQVEARELKRVR